MHQMRANILKFWVCEFFCFEVYVYTIINGGFVLSSACDQAGLWATNQTQVLNWPKAPAPVVKLDQEIDWPVSCQINLTEPGWSALAPCLMAECPFEVPHALDDSQEFEIWVCDFVF